ncbi:MAG: peroxide stress protein YaaA, partial [Clostridium sp.]|nr:peroxide stress protein YaaA [Clostridium sp.]
SIAEQNYERFRTMDLERGLTPALLSYEGIQYQYMAPAVFEKGMLSYVQEHLRILSGFYGVLKPMDGVTPYRLEMQAKAAVEGAKDLYTFWGGRLYEEVLDEDRIVVNLASKEYSRCIEQYLQPGDTFLTCVFGELSGGRVVQKGTYAKMARGEMVRYMAEHQIQELEKLKGFDRLDYAFSEIYSTEREYVFLRKPTA